MQTRSTVHRARFEARNEWKARVRVGGARARVARNRLEADRVERAFDAAVTSEDARAIANASDMNKLMERREKARKALAAAELAIGTAAMSARRAERERRRSERAKEGDEGDSEFEIFGSEDEIGCEYGYITNVAGCYIDLASVEKTGGAPRGVGAMAGENFSRELRAMVTEIGSVFQRGENTVVDTSGTTAKMSGKLRKKLESLRLDASAIWRREESREQVQAPWVIKWPYLALCVALDVLFDEKKPIQRFWFLETVARMPYFSYTSMLTLYEILGWWRRGSELRRVHFAEEWNEYHHLLIMESLGGDALWKDRFLGQHAALVYYVVLVLMWGISPALAYNFSELIEAHAVDTYAQFVDQNEAILKSMPPSRIAREYYSGADLFLFDEFQTSRQARSRRPEINNMYDVFSNIRDDEAEHVSTMNACQKPDAIVSSPNAVNAKTAAIGALVAAQIWFSRVAQTGVLEDVDDTVVDELMTRADIGAMDGFLDALFNLFHFF